jgi:hypothetical protein
MRRRLPGLFLRPAPTALRHFSTVKALTPRQWWTAAAGPRRRAQASSHTRRQGLLVDDELACRQGGQEEGVRREHEAPPRGDVGRFLEAVDLGVQLGQEPDRGEDRPRPPLGGDQQRDALDPLEDDAVAALGLDDAEGGRRRRPGGVDGAGGRIFTLGPVARAGAAEELQDANRSVAGRGGLSGRDRVQAQQPEQDVGAVGITSRSGPS